MRTRGWFLFFTACAVMLAWNLSPRGTSGGGWNPLIERAEAQTTSKKKRRARKRRRRKPARAKPAVTAPVPAVPKDDGSAQAKTDDGASPGPVLPPEKVEADVSTRSIAVTSGFTGTEIIVFGSVDNSRQTSAEAGYYDIVVVVEGTPLPLVARKKSNVAGLWINTAAASFVSVPSYYAITSTRPLDEVSTDAILQKNAIGFLYVRMTPTTDTQQSVHEADMKLYRSAVIRIKEADDLYVQDDYGVAFIGRSLFRSSVELPANVPVGPLTARVFLFREGNLLSSFSTKVSLEREGLELLLYRFAERYSFLYGLFAVLVAIGAGLLAPALFRRTSR
jgi:uncharacterized protein (TIGR02186 family)